MKRVTFVVIVAAAALASAFWNAAAKKVEREPVRFESPPGAMIDLPPDLAAVMTPLQSAAAADTFVLHWATFDSPGPDPMGWFGVDLTAQIDTFFHVADGTELDGGDGGFMVPLSGARSMWCGLAPSSAVPFCAYVTLPGYGNGWKQTLRSDPLPGDSLSLSYRVFWESEVGYDFTYVEYSFDGGTTWGAFSVGDTVIGNPGVYDNAGPTPYVEESLVAASSGATDVIVRFRFESDGGYSDEDGIRPSDGAIILDDIAVETWSGGVPAASAFEDFESAPVGSHTAGVWAATPSPAFGDFAALYPGTMIFQEDGCVYNSSFFWAFIDNPLQANYACHLPNPRPDQGVVPFGRIVDGAPLYIRNEIWSPPIANSGQGDEYRLRFRQYADNPLNNLVYQTWRVRAWKNGCPAGRWRTSALSILPFGKGWQEIVYSIGDFIAPDAEQLQIALGVFDACPYWCGIYGDGSCHSHAPMYDDVRVERIAASGPQFTVRHYDLFQDNFPEDGTVTGTARADCANDILPTTSPGILPGDSVSVTVSGLAEAGPGLGPRAYLYVAVWPPGSKTGASLGSTDTRPGKAGPRFPYAGSEIINSITWERFQLDTAFVYNTVIADRYCIDLNDALFTPGDEVRYFFGADADAVDNNGNERYWYRMGTVTLSVGLGPGRVTSDITQAAANPCEFTILPTDPSHVRFLYVDDADDRAGLPQLFVDWAIAASGLYDVFDRYDVLGPSSVVGNSLASRVKNNVTQMIDVYRFILWDSSNLSSGLVGDGVDAEKSDDFALLEQYIRTSPYSSGLLFTGDNIAEEWVTLPGAGAQSLRDDWIPFSLIDGYHIGHGEPVTPLLTAAGSSFIHSGIPDELYIYGGCPQINDFDVLQPLSNGTVISIKELAYPNSTDAAVISAQGMNSVGSIYTIVLAGFGFEFIRDIGALAAGNTSIAREEFIRDVLIKAGNIVPEPTGIDPDLGPELVNALETNYPNPFNPVTTIRYSIREKAHVSLRIYNAAGQLVRTLVDQAQSPSDVKPIAWDGTNGAGQTVSSGVYFYKLVANDFVKTRKMVLLK